MKKVIFLEGVSKTFETKERKFTALRNINLTIEKGEYVAIVGKSGSGKSTLLNMIAGIDYPTLGKIFVNDIAIDKMNESKLASWRGKTIGIVFQFFQLIPTLTVRENILLAMEFAAVIPKEKRLDRANHLLEKVDVLDQADKMPASLSGGQQQRAAIARALANNPDIIIADEPTGNLDSKTANDINALFYALARIGKTVIVVTHEKDVSSRFDRVITIGDGQILIPQPENNLL
jgi:putative ABC transport system ATP-binding protein